MVHGPLVALALQGNLNIPEIEGKFPLNANTNIERNPNLVLLFISPLSVWEILYKQTVLLVIQSE